MKVEQQKYPENDIIKFPMDSITNRSFNKKSHFMGANLRGRHLIALSLFFSIPIILWLALLVVADC